MVSQWTNSIRKSVWKLCEKESEEQGHSYKKKNPGWQSSTHSVSVNQFLSQKHITVLEHLPIRLIQHHDTDSAPA